MLLQLLYMYIICTYEYVQNFIKTLFLLVRELAEHGARWRERRWDVQPRQHGVEAGSLSGQVNSQKLII